MLGQALAGVRRLGRYAAIWALPWLPRARCAVREGKPPRRTFASRISPNLNRNRVPRGEKGSHCPILTGWMRPMRFLLAIVSLDDDGGPLFEPWWLEWLEMNRIGGGWSRLAFVMSARAEGIVGNCLRHIVTPIRIARCGLRRALRFAPYPPSLSICGRPWTGRSRATSALPFG